MFVWKALYDWYDPDIFLSRYLSGYFFFIRIAATESTSDSHPLSVNARPIWIKIYPTLYLSESHPLSVNLALLSLSGQCPCSKHTLLPPPLVTLVSHSKIHPVCKILTLHKNKCPHQQPRRHFRSQLAELIMLFLQCICPKSPRQPSCNSLLMIT